MDAGIGGARARWEQNWPPSTALCGLATDNGGTMGGGRGGGERWRSLLSEDAPPALQVPPADPPPAAYHLAGLHEQQMRRRLARPHTRPSHSAPRLRPA